MKSPAPLAAPGLIELAGQAPGVESAAAECLWLKQHEPYHFQRATSFLSARISSPTG
jgi:xylulokinase